MAVETAIVMPLFIFIMLGLLQLGLMHQARLVTKYAAFKATRAGSINRGDLETMENAALAVLVPLISREAPMGGGRRGGGQDQYGLYDVSSPERYARAFDDIATARGNQQSSQYIAEVTVCHPTQTDGTNANTDFDDPQVNPLGGNANWRPFERTKLAVQVTYYYHLIIPFANAFIWYAAFQQETAEHLQTLKMLRLKGDDVPGAARVVRDTGQAWTLESLESEARAGRYLMPIRGSYAMRMMSNFAPNTVPSRNRCRVPWRRLTTH